jgi:hypothetical protein
MVLSLSLTAGIAQAVSSDKENVWFAAPLNLGRRRDSVGARREGEPYEGQPRGCGTPTERLQHGLELRPRVIRVSVAALSGALRSLDATRRRVRAANPVTKVAPRLKPRPKVKVAPPSCPPHTFTAWIRRRVDLLDLRFEFYNLELVTSGPGAPKLVRANKSIHSSRIVVVFPRSPQNVADEAFLETSKMKQGSKAEPLPEVGLARARIAGETRLAFEVGDVEIPFQLDSLLGWAAFPQAIVEVAKTQPVAKATKKKKGVPNPNVRKVPKPRIRKPLECETQIELPWRVVLSPNEHGGWAHAAAAITHGGRTELWHTRLGVRTPTGGVDERDDDGRRLRAVWALDPDFANHLKEGTRPDDPSAQDVFTMSLKERDRYEIVRASSDYTIPSYTPTPLTVRRLILSALGGTLDSRGLWDVPKGNNISLEEWRHIASMGRDCYVRVVHRGYAWPFGHRAVTIEVAERKFSNKGAQRVAYLRKYYLLLPRQREKRYGATGTPGMPHGGRGFPFKSIEIATLVTPQLDAPKPYIGADAGIFQPKLDADERFLFHMIGTDWAGNRRDFTTPIVFVDQEFAIDTQKMFELAAAYNSAAAADREASFEGQGVAIAQPNNAGDTTVEVSTMRWAADVLPKDGPVPNKTALDKADQPYFWPKLADADVRIGPAEQASGTAAASTPKLELDPSYVGADYGPGQVFAKLKDPSPLRFGADRSGGVATPNFGISGLSRHLGPVGGKLDTVKGGQFTPGDFFQGETPKLLGGVDLKEVVNGTSVAGATPPEEAPKLTYRTEGNVLHTHLAWKPSLKSDAKHVFQPSGPNGPASLSLDVELKTDVTHPDDSTYTVDGNLRNFTLNLVGDGAATKFLVLTFNRLHFTAKKGQKAHVDVDLAGTEFAGVLKFVQQLKDVMEIGSGDKAPAIEVDAQGISAQTAMPIPDLAVGVFALTNLKFSASLNIPFSGKPVRVRFAFSDRADTFLLQIAMFAGGGFFAIAVGGDGVEQVEAALEFGASVSIDIGVASGGVHLLAGIYFSYALDPDTDPQVETTILTGYVKLGGELSVLGIVSMSLEFYMDLSYANVGGHEKTVGTATLSVEVDVLMFSETVTCTVKKQFGDGDPSFQDQLPSPSLWDEYCNAFAAVG